MLAKLGALIFVISDGTVSPSSYGGRSAQNPMGNLQNFSFDDCVKDLREVVRSFSTPPVLLAMNLGALIALKVCEQSKPSALILVSPSPPENLTEARSRPQRLLWLKYRLLILLHRPIQIDEKDFRAYFLTPLPENLQRALPARRYRNPARWFASSSCLAFTLTRAH